MRKFILKKDTKPFIPVGNHVLMGEVCRTCEYVTTQYRNEVTGQPLYFCKALCIFVYADCSCGFFKEATVDKEEK